MNNKPIEFFKNNKEFQKCAKEWQHRLFLDDWFIKFELVNKELVSEDKTSTLFGFCKNIWENHEAYIQISHLKDTKGLVTPNCEELTLIHELLHCFIFTIELNSDEELSYETVYINTIQHSKIEQLAKSLLMAKYNLNYDYFYGTKE